MSVVSIQVDEKQIQASTEERLLWALLDEGIFVPHLCGLRGIEPPHGGCRLCWVELEGVKKPVASCSVMVKEGLKVRTRSAAIDSLVRAGFELLLSVHRLDCKICPGNGSCALQEMARMRKLPLRSKRLPKIEPDFPLDESRAEIGINPNHCVLCGRCIEVCNHEVKKGILETVNRGLDSRVSTFNQEPLSTQGCGDCVRCAEVCPVGAIYKRMG